MKASLEHLTNVDEAFTPLPFRIRYREGNPSPPLMITTREIPGVALVNILIRWIFMGKGNTHLKWNIEVVAHVEEKIFEWDTIFCEIAF